MKILLANPATKASYNDGYERFFIKAGSRWPWSVIKQKSKKNTNIFFPFYLAYSASVLRSDGHDVHMIDGVAMDMPNEDFLERAAYIKPDIVIIETQTHAFAFDISLCEKIKDIIKDVKIILTGPHVTIFAEEILKKNKIIDFVTLGEYEFTLGDLINRIASGAKNSEMDGLGYRINDRIWVSNKKGYIEDINLLPYPAFDIFPSNEEPDLSIYSDGICVYRPAITLHTSRGCPFSCDFCLWTQVMYGNKKYRMFSPKRVVDEMEYVIKNYGAKEIYFDDDNFCVNKNHVLDICNEIKERKLDIKWSCMGDAICIDENMLKAMGESGCISMKFGVESGNKQILKNIGKPLDPEKAVGVAQWCRRYGIFSHATFSFGLDGETAQTMIDTLRLANRIKFDYAQVSITTPFPGTRYFDKLSSRGEIRELDWHRFDGTSFCVFNTQKLTSQQIVDFRKKAIISMVLHKIIDPIWVMRYIKRNVLLIINRGMEPLLSTLRSLYSIMLAGDQFKCNHKDRDKKV